MQKVRGTVVSTSTLLLLLTISADRGQLLVTWDMPQVETGHGGPEINCKLRLFAGLYLVVWQINLSVNCEHFVFISVQLGAG